MKASPPRSGIATTREFRHTVRVYYEDTDAGGVVYYANYLKFCERARTEWLRNLGFEQNQLHGSAGIVFVVRAINAEYLDSAELDDQLTVVSSIDQLGGASIAFAQRVLREGTVIFDARVKVACVDRKRKKVVALPPDIRQRFAKPT